MKNTFCNYKFELLKTKLEHINKYSITRSENYHTLENKDIIKTNIVTELIFFSRKKDDKEKNTIKKFEIYDLDDALYPGMDIIIIMATIDNEEYIYKLINPITNKVLYKNYLAYKIEKCVMKNSWSYKIWNFMFNNKRGEIGKPIKIFIIYTILMTALLMIIHLGFLSSLLISSSLYLFIAFIAYLNVSNLKKKVKKIQEELESSG